MLKERVHKEVLTANYIVPCKIIDSINQWKCRSKEASLLHYKSHPYLPHSPSHSKTNITKHFSILFQDQEPTMVAITYDIEIPSSVPASKMFKAMVLDVDALVPKIMPQAIKSVEILEGDGGVGTVKIIHFGEGSNYKSAKHRVDAIDKENLTHTYSIIEGDALAGALESITYHIKIVPTEDGGSI